MVSYHPLFYCDFLDDKAQMSALGDLRRGAFDAQISKIYGELVGGFSRFGKGLGVEDGADADVYF
jgi:hypothetical protein